MFFHHCVDHVSPVWLSKHTHTHARKHTHVRHHAAVLQYAGYYNCCAAFCEGGVITVIRVAVGGSWVLLEEHGDSLEKQVLSLTGVKLCKYMNTLRQPTYLTPACEKWLLINTTTLQLLMMNRIQLNWTQAGCVNVSVRVHRDLIWF